MSAGNVGILLATRNGGKVREVREILGDLGVEIVSLLDVSGAPDVVEDGATFRENALKKARALAGWSGRVTLADDSGLEVDSLGGRPGVRSARFAGEGVGDEANNRKLLAELQSVPPEERSARFRCVMALAFPDGREWVTEGSCEGVIVSALRGTQGFGYDPLFLVPSLEKTFGELTLQEKNRVSHRARALHEMKAVLRSVLGEEGAQVPRPGD
jgi:XTP/dITP diphosphohydrolase